MVAALHNLKEIFRGDLAKLARLPVDGMAVYLRG
jgi:hypothetical protein